MRHVGGFLIAGALFVLVAWASMGCATQMAASGIGCPVIGEIQTGTKITCREVIVERNSAAESIRATGEALGGALRGLLGLPTPGVTP